MVNEATDIALSELRRCYGEKGIFAGLHHFKDYWARDSFFASLGSLAAGDHDIVKKNLELFLDNMKKDGQIPLRVGKSSLEIALSYLGIGKNSKRKPIYSIDKTKSVSIDQNSLLIIAFSEYLNETKDKSFAEKYAPKIERAVHWNLSKDIDSDYLIEEEGYSNWADSIKKKGKVLYTNVCFCHSLICASDIMAHIGKKNEQKEFHELYIKTKKAINDRFWNSEHYLDWIDGSKEYNYFSTDGNVLAIMWDIADKEKSNKIEECSHVFDINDVPSVCVHPDYPINLVSLQTRLLGLKDYHNGLSWLWLGAINAIAKHKVNRNKEANDLLNKIAALIVEYGAVYEVYTKNAMPLKRLIYRAEQPFAWSSGLFLYAVKKIKGKL